MDQAIVTLGVLACVAFLFVTEWIPVSVAALIGAVSLGVFGILTPEEVFSGFSNSNVILFSGMFVVGAAVLESGLAQMIGNFVVRHVGKSQGPLILALMLLTVIMSAFASNTGTVACLLPMVIGVCVSAKIASAPVLMSLAVAANSGCMLTMVGTPPNMIAVAEITAAGLPSYGFFEFSWIAAPIAIASVLFMCLIGRHLLPQKSADGGLIAKSKGVKGSHRQRVTALVILIFVVLGLIIGIPGVSPAMISLTAAILCVLTGCITEKQAYKGIDWPTVFLFGGMLPVALAMQKTGAGEIIATFVSDIVGNAPSVYLIVSVIFLCSVLLSQFMPNTATASLLIPISMSIASKLNLSPYGVLITCAMGASCSFATPIATPCNTLVLRASNLHFKDYLKVGLPLIGIALLLCNLIVPKVWPL